MENGEWWKQRFVKILFAATSTLSLIHFPFSNVLGQAAQSELPAPISSRTISPRFENLSLEDGLSQTWVYDMHQDRHGFIWIGTQDGLNRYDGHEIKSYVHAVYDSTSLSPGWVQAIDEDEFGNIWVATLRGVSRMDAVTGRFARHLLDLNDINTDLLVDRSGTVWVGNWGEGLFGTTAENPGNFVNYRHDPEDSTSIAGDRIGGLFEDSEGRLWIRSNDGEHWWYSIVEPENPGQFKNVPADSLGGFIYERPEEPGIFWMTNGRQLIRYDYESGERSLHDLEPGTNLRLREIAQDPNNPNILWIAIFGGGLGRFDIRSGAFVRYRADPNNPNSLSTDRARQLLVDRSGMIWVGTFNNGVDRFNPASIGFEHIRGDPSADMGLPGSIVWQVYQTRDGVLWVATEDEETNYQITAIDRKAGTARYFQSDPDDPASIPNARVEDFLEDRQGRLWLATVNGLGLIDRQTGRFIAVGPESPRTRNETYSPEITVTSMMEDQGGAIWVGWKRGLGRIAPGGDFHIELIAGNEQDPETIWPGRYSDIVEDGSGYIWIGGRALSRLDPVTRRVKRFDLDPDSDRLHAQAFIMDLHLSRSESNVLWFGTFGAGLGRLNTKTGEVRYLTIRDGLPNDIVYTVLEDESGRLWFSSNKGLTRFNPETGEIRNYGLEIGLQSLEFSPAGRRGPFGEMFFGGVNGLNAFFPNALTENDTPPDVAIVDLKLSNRSVRESGEIPLDRPIEDTEQIVLRYDQKDLTLEFVAFHYQHAELNQFAYKLEGFNDDWVEAGRKRSATFTNLAPGEYTFRVKAANSDGVWNEDGASLRIIVEPPFWATWWFRIAGFLAFAGLIYGGYSLRVRQVEARARELEGQVNERTAELKMSNAQLEQSATIVEAINQETSFRRLLTKILEEARVIPGVEKATAIVYMKDDDRFHVRASSGWDVAAMQNIRLTRREARSRYVERADEVSEDIFVARDVADREASEQMAEFGKVASFIVLRIQVEDEVAGYLIFDNLTDPSAFDQRDVELLERLREHIQSAFIKTRILEDLQTTLTDLQSTQDRLIQSEKMASLGQLTAGIAHEIKNPLNFVNNFSDLTTEVAGDLSSEFDSIKGMLPDDKVAEFESLLESLRINAEKIAEHGKRADGIVENMLEHSKSGDGRRVPTDINDLLEEYLVLAHHAQRAEDDGFELTIERDLDDSIGKVDIVPQEMGRVFMNLIGNAFDALREKGKGKWEKGKGPTVMVSTSRSDSEDFSGVEIRIADNGPGIPDQVRDKIFEPFFTTKPAGSGTGLGLSMSYDIITKGHGGSLEVESVEGEGATFIVRLPA